MGMTMNASTSPLPPLPSLISQDTLSSNLMNYNADTTTSATNSLLLQSLSSSIRENRLMEQMAQAQENRRDYHLTQALIQMQRARDARLIASLTASTNLISSSPSRITGDT